MKAILEVTDLKKSYKGISKDLTVLEDVRFTIDEGEIVSIVGPSGSGKTTLLGLCAGLDTPTSGKIVLTNEDITDKSENDKAKVRNQNVGFIFQNFHKVNTSPSSQSFNPLLIPRIIRPDHQKQDRADNIFDGCDPPKRDNRFVLTNIQAGRRACL